MRVRRRTAIYRSPEDSDPTDAASVSNTTIESWGNTVAMFPPYCLLLLFALFGYSHFQSCVLVIMPREAPFTAVSRKMLDAWIETDPACPVEPEKIYGSILSMLSIKMRLTVFRIEGDDPQNWKMTPIRHSGFTTSLFDVNKVFEDQRIGNFRDQAYMAEAVIPRLKQVIENQQPSIELVKTKLFGINLGYDRILIPQKSAGRAQWVISSSYARFLLDTPKNYGKFDVGDEAVVQLLLEGCTAKEIAAQLGLSHRTIEHRLEKLKERFGARNTVHLVVMLLGNHVGHDTGTTVN